MEYLIYSVGIYFIYFFCGIGLTFLLCPKPFEKYSFFLAPIIGLIYFSYAGLLFAYYTDFGSNVYAQFLLIPSLIFIILAILIKKNRISELKWPFKKENILLSCICILIFIGISAPFLFKVNVLTTMTLGNNDIAHYAAVSKYLTQYSFTQTTINNDSYFIGMSQGGAHYSAYFSTCIPSSLLQLATYKIQNITTNLFFVFLIPLIFLISVEIFKFKKNIALITSLLVGFSFHLIFIDYHGFIGQILGTGIFLSLFLMTYYSINNCNSLKDYIQYIPITSLLLFGLFVCYSPLFPLYFIPLFLFLLTIFISSNFKFKILVPTIYILTSIIISFILNPLIIIRIISDFLIYNNVFGWSVPILNPLWAFGLAGNNIFMQNNSIMNWILSVPIIIIIIMSFWYLYKKDRNLFYLAASYFLVFLFIYIYLEYKDLVTPEFTGESYKAYKLFTYYLPIFIISSLSIFRDFNILNINRKSSIKKIFGFLFIILLILGNIYSASAIIYVNYNYGNSVDNDIIDLDKITEMENVSSINVAIPPFWDQMWAYYFLFMNKTLYLKESSYYPNSPQIGDWTLEGIHYENEIDDIYVNDIISYIPDDREYIKLNDKYALIKGNLSVKLKDGWYIPEYNNYGSVWRWTGKNYENITIDLHSRYDISDLDIYISFLSLEENNNLTILIDNKEINEIEVKDSEIPISIFLQNITLSNGNHEIVFKSKYPAKILDTGDPRSLCYAFYNITFIQNSETINGN